MNNELQPLWVPSKSLISRSNLMNYMNWLKESRQISFSDYDSLWTWSAEHVEDFWESLWKYFDIIRHTPYSSVMNSPEGEMIGTRWFEGSTLNYAEHIFRHKSSEHPAIIFQSEKTGLKEITWVELEASVSSVAAWLREQGVVKGDRVVSLLPNIPETVIAFLAVNSIGAVWSSCSPDFGTPSVTDRFAQVEPKILFAADGYSYNGKTFEKLSELEEIISRLPTLKKVVLFNFIGNHQLPGSVSWQKVAATDGGHLRFEPVEFNHPIWIVYSSGTTGKPKAITHSHGGCLLEHLKALAFHQDVKKGERYFWFSTTGWMMWNFSVASLLTGATLCIYEGSASYPDLNVLWNFAKEAGIHHFGGGAAFYIACMKAGMSFGENEFPLLRTIGSTGSPLPPEAFEWIYHSVKQDVWLISLSGGTDICSCFVGGNPFSGVHAGEIQCRLLGCHLEAFNEQARPVRNELGEMVILSPMPSMPVYFWNDPGNEKYRASYFEQYPGIWRHGDWISISERGSVIIYGRSDATLNRDGVRIGTSEVYSALNSVKGITDSLVVSIEEKGGKYFMPLFVVLDEGVELTDELKAVIRKELRTQYSPRHVPDEIYPILQVPYTISGKKMETPVKKILMGMDPDKAANKDTMKNPGAMEQFVRYRRSEK